MRGRAFRKILVAVRSSEDAGRPMDLAITIAALNHAELVILHVLPPVTSMVPAPGFGVPPLLLSNSRDESYDRWRRKDERWLSRLVTAAEENGVRATAEVTTSGTPVVDEGGP